MSLVAQMSFVLIDIAKIRKISAYSKYLGEIFPKLLRQGVTTGTEPSPWPIKRLLSAPWKLLAIVRNFRTAARNFRRLARNLHAVAGAVLLRLFHHVVAQLLEWFSASCSYIIVVICPFLPSPLPPPTPRLGGGGVRGGGVFQRFPTITRA